MNTNQVFGVIKKAKRVNQVTQHVCCVYKLMECQWHKLREIHQDVLKYGNTGVNTIQVLTCVRTLLNYEFISAPCYKNLCTGSGTVCLHCHRLLWLTIWRNVFEKLDKGTVAHITEEVKKTSFFQMLRYCLSNKENRFEVYSAQKIYTEALKHSGFEFAARELVHFLLEVQLVSPVPYLEIFCNLLSRKNPQCHSVIPIARPFLINVCDVLLRSHDQSHDTSGLYALISVWIKVAKLVNIYSDDTAEKLICYILQYSEILLDLMFAPKARNEESMLRHKILHFYRVLLNYEQISKGAVGKLNYLAVTMFLFAKVMEKTLAAFPVNRGVPSFTGAEMFSGVPNAREVIQAPKSTVHIQELSLLCLKLCFVITRSDSVDLHYINKTKQFLFMLDVFIKNKLAEESGENGDNHFDWLSSLYGDQDDAWIEAMLLLLEIKLHFTTRLQSDASDFIQPHKHFYQFVMATTFDHSILVDLLTSPETYFLTYLMKYLKFVSCNWPTFTKFYSMPPESSSCIKPTENHVDNISHTLEISMRDIMDDSNQSPASFQEDQSVVSQSEIALQKTAVQAEATKTFKQTTEKLRQGACTVTEKYVENSAGTVDSCTLKGSDRTSNTDKTQGKVTQGLYLIMNSYDDEEEEEENKKEMKSEMISQPSISRSPAKSWGHETYLPLNSAIGEDDSDIDSGADNFVSGETDLERVMSVLIRVRMKVEKLWESSVFPYNPTPILKHLRRTENLYEGGDC